MPAIQQQPTALSLLGVAGSPFTLTLDVTVKTETGTTIPWATVTSPTVKLKGAGTTKLPTITTPSTNHWKLEWTATQTTSLLGATLSWALLCTIQGYGPSDVVAGTLTFATPTVPGNSSSSSGSLAVTVGSAAVSLTLTLGGSAGAVSSVNGKTGAVVLHAATVTAAPLASPAFTGTPSAPTAAVGTNTTQLATTAFVQAAAIHAGTLAVSGSTYTPTLVAPKNVLHIATPTAAFTIANPTGTAADGQSLILEIVSGATAYGITWGTAYKSSGVATLPASGVASKTITCGFLYNTAKTAWVLLSLDAVGY